MTTKTPASPVYMVYVCHSVSDRALLEKYRSSIGPDLGKLTYRIRI